MRLFFTFTFCVLSLLMGSAHAERFQPSASGREAKFPPTSNGTAATQEMDDDLPPIPTIDLTTPPDDLWQRVRNGFAMPDLNSSLVANQQAWYLNHPQYLQRIFERCQRYLYYVTAELEKRGMPTELALLPIIESAYNPQARSSARAMGMWQFIPSTGKNYNLKQNIWVDERRDIVASTNAALDYLQYIYEMHGDWQLALASYNWGEGAVGRSIAKNRAKGLPGDYSHLTMPGETRNYVPKLQAIKNIVANPQLFGIALETIPNQPYFSVVGRDGNMDVALAAHLAGIPMAEFMALNPAYNRPVMPGSANSPLVLPADKVQTYLDNLQDHEAQDKPLSAWRTYTLARGEKLESVARRHGLSLGRLKQLNGLTKRTKIYPGLALLVPGKGAIISDSLAEQIPQEAPEPKTKIKTKNKAKSKVKASSQKRIHVTVRSKKPAAKTPSKRKRR